MTSQIRHKSAGAHGAIPVPNNPPVAPGGAVQPGLDGHKVAGPPQEEALAATTGTPSFQSRSPGPGQQNNSSLPDKMDRSVTEGWWWGALSPTLRVGPSVRLPFSVHEGVG
eukprot:CAMPEP_0174371022 /NCGR_PEP_ID=MMETSP0811_2-20130205/98228_1 /TAXON_ID=73025 ORGANISM="Eutreptiella gymnastica-like, Strain CCMP1594" /NCGR_SAMPLE_ID=MMETSP0811_2 /ASSEMBLY_ACC=CAM_ASM_000667 /LENGTH=110 /DNA_ID=CAMNT_0015517011 /DNA_START=231 /DNA_END=560 /DNA_ORIENTATION=-